MVVLNKIDFVSPSQIHLLPMTVVGATALPVLCLDPQANLHVYEPLSTVFCYTFNTGILAAKMPMTKG